MITLSSLLLSFTIGDNKSQYSIPLAAWSVTAGDIDLDGDNDIVVGHNYSTQTEWSGVSIMINDGNGYFNLFDSVYLYAGQSDIILEDLNSLPNKEIVGNFINIQTGAKYIAIINDFNLTNISYFNLNTQESINDKALGDINGDGNKDIVIVSHDEKFWGVLYNDGNGNFSLPQYNYVSDYFPTELACGDLNFDNRDDIVICGQSTEVYFSYPGGFELITLETNDFKEDAAIVDFDLDGDNDIITFVGIPVVNVSSLIMYENLGNNQFDTLPEFYFLQISSRIFVTDFDNDSLPDVLFQLSDKSGYIIYYNEGDFQLNNPQFVALPPSNPQEGWRNCYCEDMDGNGYKDIITVKTLYIYMPDNLEILFNDGNGNFLEDPLTNDQTSNFELQPQNLTCYPNPFSDKLTIEVKNSALDEKLEIYDIKGCIVNKIIIDRNNFPHTDKYLWNGKDLKGKEVQKGLYLVRLQSGRKVYSQRVIKIN